MHKHFHIQTSGEGLYKITDDVQRLFEGFVLENNPKASGMLFIVCMHTSCGLLVNEGYDKTAQDDIEAFLKHIAPRNLPFIKHTAEGSDDSPSHMKSALLQQNLAFLIEKGELLLGMWQAIYLAEFRDSSRKRNIMLKFIEG